MPKLAKTSLIALSIVVLAALFTTPARAQFTTVTIMPQAPHSQELVTMRVNWAAIHPCVYADVAMAQNNITVTIHCFDTFQPPPPAGWFDVDLGRFPAGSFTVTVLETYPGIPPKSLSFVTTERHSFTGSSTNFPFTDYTDHWWNPQESGWGISIMQHVSDRLFAVWFVYGPNGQPIWYTLQPGRWITYGMYSGPIYKTTGPYFAGAFDPDQVVLTQAGTGTLLFADSTSGTFSYTIDGVSGSKPIVRLPF